MEENVMIGIGLIVILGIAAQWLAWRFKLPSILMLLLFGFLAGPVSGILHPEEVLGGLLFPAVSLSVGIILFEGGLGLRVENLREVRAVVRNLISLGSLIVIVVGAPAAHFLLGLNWSISILLASILVVTGPTVVIPLLRFIRPSAKIASILRWEGILIDPVGATLAVLAFEAIKGGGAYTTHIPNMIVGILLTLLIGGVLGAIAALLLVSLFERGLVPDYLQTPIALLILLAMFMFSNSLIPESGLMGATIMGVVLANQKRVNIEHIVEFKEQLGILLLSVLFIVLSARVQLDDFVMIGWGGLVFVLILIFVARPLSVWVSTRGSDLSTKEVLFLGWMAPRGIVAMAVASLFALELEEAGFAGAELITPIVILVVVGTVVLYSLTAGPLARKLDLVEKDPQGVLIVGANRAALRIGVALKDAGFTVAMIDTNNNNVLLARQSGLLAIENSVFSDSAIDQIPLGEIGYMLALTPDDQVNALAALRFETLLGKDNVYQLNPAKGEFSDSVRKKFHGKYLFQCEETYESMDTAIGFGGQVRILEFNQQEDVAKYQETHGEKEILLFTIDSKTHLHVATCDSVLRLQTDQKVISLKLPDVQPEEAFWEKLHPYQRIETGD
jgi:NhaP-type Na+/H+ or K+/H+ antiporter